MKNTKRHTKPCIYFQTNTCPLSAEDCDYSHVIASPEELESLKLPQSTLRTKPCRFYLAGQCKDGFWCRFKHPAGVRPPSENATSPTSTEHPSDEPVEISSGSETGYSSDADIRDVEPQLKAKPDQHPKYRTRPCRNFLLGGCAYGERCIYVHVPLSPSQDPSSGQALGLQLDPPPPPHSTPRPLETNSRAEGQAESDSPPSSAASGMSTQTMVSSSAYLSDEPTTPASPGSPCPDRYVPIPTGLPAYPGTYQPKPIMNINLTFPMPPNSPFGYYTPTIPPPLSAVGVSPPPYQLQHCRPSRPRSRSQSHGAQEMFASRSAYYRSKPCKFFVETGKCQKGNRCNFIHDQDASAKQKSDEEGDFPSESEDGNERNKGTNNFYKINWRVVGGGVMVGSPNDPSHQGRQHAHDPLQSSVTYGKLSPLAVEAAIIADSSHTKGLLKCKGSWKGTKATNGLSLKVQALHHDGPHVVITQDDEEEKSDEGRDNKEDVQNKRKRQSLPLVKEASSYSLRSKSSPSSPAATQTEFAKRFSAESP